MSEESLRRFIERLNADASFRDRVQQDPQGAFTEFELSPSEWVALGTQDEDALRRLAGTDVSPFMGWSEFDICKLFPTFKGQICPDSLEICTNDCTVLCRQHIA